VRRERVINKLRELGYGFKRNAWRVAIFRNPRTMHVIQVRNKDDISDDWVRQALRQAGVPSEEIERFIRDCVN